MKKILLSLVVLLIFAPSVSFAAPLTQAQAESLINVVKASPGTPASAFTSLITAFSNITATQAGSLIGVVQSSPGAPANAFVGLLISFTQDTQAVAAVQNQSQNVSAAPVPTQSQSTTNTTQTNTVSGSPATVVIKADTLGIVSTGLQAFYNASSDSASEVDIKTINATVTGVDVTGGVVISINDDTNNQTLVASTQSSSFNPVTHTLAISATLNKPLKIQSGYPTMFDIKASNIYPFANSPLITITSIGSGFIFNSKSSAAVLPNSLNADAKAFYSLHGTCQSLQGDAYTDCINYSINK